MNFYQKNPRMCIPHGVLLGVIVGLMILLIKNDFWVPEVWMGVLFGGLGGILLQFVILPWHSK